MDAAELKACLPVARRLAEAARPIALRHFRSAGLDVDDKSAADAGYDPVTLADREIERAMRAILADHRPEDGILGEEYEDVPTRSGVTWVLDPIDGTRAFVCGLPNWGVLIAANDGIRPVIGIMDQPFTGERFTGVTLPNHRIATLNDLRALRAGRTEALSDALLCCTSPDMFRDPAERDAFDRLSAQVRMTRYGTDCYGFAMLAMGQVDLVVEADLKPYDIQALIPLIEAAGGMVSTWRGGDPQHGGRIIAAATSTLHAAALLVLETA